MYFNYLLEGLYNSEIGFNIQEYCFQWQILTQFLQHCCGTFTMKSGRFERDFMHRHEIFQSIPVCYLQSRFNYFILNTALLLVAWIYNSYPRVIF